ncbi:hypothetical protein D3C76_946140 [compost metagenome]
MPFAFEHVQHDVLERGQVARRFNPPGLGVQIAECIAGADHQGTGEFGVRCIEGADTHLFDLQRINRSRGEADVHQLPVFLCR